MAQRLDTTGIQETSTVVRVDADITSWNTLVVGRGLVDIIEGGLADRDANGNAILPRELGGLIVAQNVMINFGSPAATDVADRQTIPQSGGPQYTAALPGAGYAMIAQPVRVGLPLTARYFTQADLNLFVPGALINLRREVTVGAERFGAIKLGFPQGTGVLPAAPAANDGWLSFGTVDYIENANGGTRILWFFFHPNGVRA